MKIRSIYIVLCVSFLWTLADGLISFYLPQQIENKLHNVLLFGLLYAMYPGIGLLTDFIFSYKLRKIKYPILLAASFSLMIILSLLAIAPLTIFSIMGILVARGIYYEFFHLGIFQYVARFKYKGNHGKIFGFIYLLQDFSYTIAPVLAGLLILRVSYALYPLSIAISLIAFLTLAPLKRIHRYHEHLLVTYDGDAHRGFLEEIKKFRRALRFGRYILLGVCLYYLWDACIWALLPLEGPHWGEVFTGFIIAAFTLPLVLFQGYGGIIADKYGRKKVFFVSSMLAAVFTCLFGITVVLELKVISAFISASCYAFAYPAMLSILSSHKTHNINEVTSLERISANIGLIAGPVFGGILSRFTSIDITFLCVGITIFVITAGELFSTLRIRKSKGDLAASSLPLVEVSTQT